MRYSLPSFLLFSPLITKANSISAIIRSFIDEHIYPLYLTTFKPGSTTSSLSYDIITKVHQGKIELETEEGIGTTFTIILPAK